MDTCNLSPEYEEIQSQFIEFVPGYSEYGTGMIAAISHMAHKELKCLRELMEQKGNIHQFTHIDIGVTSHEFEQFHAYIRHLEEIIIDIINPQAKKDGYIAFDLTEVHRQGLGKYVEYISLLYKARYVHGEENTQEHIQYLNLPEWDGSRKMKIFLGNDGKKFFIKSIHILPIHGEKSPEDLDIPHQDYKSADGKYFG